MRLIDELYTGCPFYGSRKITEELTRRGEEVNRKRVQRLMREMGLYSGPRKLDHRLSYTGGPEEGKQWRASGRVTGPPSRPRSHWPLTRATARSTNWPVTMVSTRR